MLKYTVCTQVSMLLCFVQYICNNPVEYGVHFHIFVSIDAFSWQSLPECSIQKILCTQFGVGSLAKF